MAPYTNYRKSYNKSARPSAYKPRYERTKSSYPKSSYTGSKPYKRARYTRPAAVPWDQAPGNAGVNMLSDTVRVKYSRTLTIQATLGNYTQNVLSVTNPGNVNAAGEAAVGFPASLAGYDKYYVSGAKFTVRILADPQSPLEIKTLLANLHPNTSVQVNVSNVLTNTRLCPAESGSAVVMTEKYSAKRYHKMEIAQNPAIIGTIQTPPTSPLAFFLFIQSLGSQNDRPNVIVQLEVDYFLRLGARIAADVM